MIQGTRENLPLWYSQAESLTQKIFNLKNALVFRMPVDPIALAIPDYFEIIKNPMDLSTVLEKLQSRSYENQEDWVKDMNLIFENAKIYNNPESYVYKCAVECSEEFNNSLDT